ncbi:MAG: DUF6382 domain-containing protein [Anaerovoracaceae bacterium]
MNVDLRKENYRLDIPAEHLHDYEERTLTSGLCDFILPMQFYFHGERVEMLYQCSGYTCAAELPLTTARQYFELLAKAIESLSKAGEFLLDPERMCLTRQTVFYHRRCRDVKIAYVPAAAEPIPCKLAGFAEELAGSAEKQEQARQMLQQAAEEIRTRHLDFAAALECVGRLRREMHVCGIE